MLGAWRLWAFLSVNNIKIVEGNYDLSGYIRDQFEVLKFMAKLLRLNLQLETMQDFE
jgi:hypothetical protein